MKGRMLMKVNKIGADIGNNSCKFESELGKFSFSSSLAEYYPNHLELEQEITLEQAAASLMNHLDFTVTSPVLEERRYIVGQKILNDNLTAVELELKSDKSKDDKLKYLCLIGLAVDAIKRQKTIQAGKVIKVNYDLGLALPIKQINKERAQLLADKYMNTHKLYWHVGNQSIAIEIKIEYARCIAEGQSAIWGLVYDENFQPLTYKLNIDGQEVETTLENKMLVGADIGGGTTELAVTRGVVLQLQLSDGLSFGTKEAIENRLSIWNKEFPKKEINSIAEFNNIYYDPSHPRHNMLRNSSIMEATTRELAYLFHKPIVNCVNKIKDDVILFIFGGGQVFINSNLKALLKQNNSIENIIFVDNAIYANARGLYVYVSSPRFNELKQRHYETVGIEA